MPLASLLLLFVKRPRSLERVSLDLGGRARNCATLRYAEALAPRYTYLLQQLQLNVMKHAASASRGQYRQQSRRGRRSKIFRGQLVRGG